jgi:hypothetical protein
MTRTDLIEPIADYAGPLGPFREPEEQEQQFRQWLSGARFDWLEPLLDLLFNPPPEASHIAVKNGWDVALVECLTHVGKLNPQRFLERVEPHLMREEARLFLIWVIGWIGHREGVRVLIPLAETGILSDEELCFLAGAFGEIGGQEAREILLHMQATVSAQKKDVHREINNALKGC